MHSLMLRLIFSIACLAVISMDVVAESSQRELVLVADQELNISALTPLEIRKLFLGVPVFRDGETIQPLINETDPELLEIFLQKVIFMSRRTYYRELLSRVYRLGGAVPIRIAESSELFARLHSTPGLLSFMWSDEARQTQGLKVLGVIWAGSIN